MAPLSAAKKGSDSGAPRERGGPQAASLSVLPSFLAVSKQKEKEYLIPPPTPGFLRSSPLSACPLALALEPQRTPAPGAWVECFWKNGSVRAFCQQKG